MPLNTLPCQALYFSFSAQWRKLWLLNFSSSLGFPYRFLRRIALRFLAFYFSFSTQRRKKTLLNFSFIPRDSLEVLWLPAKTLGATSSIMEEKWNKPTCLLVHWQALKSSFLMQGASLSWEYLSIPCHARLSTFLSLHSGENYGCLIFLQPYGFLGGSLEESL